MSLLLLLFLLLARPYRIATPSGNAPGGGLPGGGAPGGTPLPFPPPAVDDALLATLVAACTSPAAGETFVYIDHPAGAVVATRSFRDAVAARACPPIDIMLAAEHRSIGL